MDRKMIYPGQIPLETDMLDTNRFALIGLGKLAAAVLGTTTLVNGLDCTPTAPASMQVQVAPGEIYSLQNLDGTAYSSLAADTTHQILKQGLLMDAVTLNCPAPATSGQSINYLVQATYQDTDSNAVVLPYYNASNPTQAYTGPNNSGTAQNTVRKGVCTVSVKEGIAATTGTQTTPAPDSGYVGLYVVTVAYGQSTITAGNISTASGAPFLNSTLLGLAPAFTAIPTSPTPSQFDNSTKSATTAFVQRALGNMQGGVVLGAAKVLTAADAGKVFSLNVSASPITLPLFNTVPSGSKLAFVNVGSTNVVIQRSGTDTLFGPSGIGASSFSSSLTSYTLLPGDSCEFTACAQWEITGGTCLMQATSSFAASKSGNGYQKLPSGMIIQWGTVTISANSVVAVTFPIAFPNAGLVGYASKYDAAANGTQYRWDCSAPGQTQMNIANNWSGSIAGSWLAIGY
jgi:hypothetical protein